MNDTFSDWECHRAFLAVAREGSLSGAARVLYMAQPTVRRRIEALEENLGMRLFLRSQSGLALTESARGLLAHAEAMEAAAGAFARAATGAAGTLGGTVRLATTDTLGVEVLPPLLAALRARHPALAVELSLGTRLERLSAQEADIALRHVRPTEEATVAKRIGAVKVGLFATPAFLAAHGSPASLEELAHFSLVGPDRAVADLRKLAEYGFNAPGTHYALRSDSRLAQFAAVRAGLGIGACHARLAARAGLVAVLPEAFSFTVDLWLAMHEDVRQVGRVRLVFDHLAAALAAYVEQT